MDGSVAENRPCGEVSRRVPPRCTRLAEFTALTLGGKLGLLFTRDSLVSISTSRAWPLVNCEHTAGPGQSASCISHLTGRASSNLLSHTYPVCTSLTYQTTFTSPYPDLTSLSFRAFRFWPLLTACPGFSLRQSVLRGLVGIFRTLLTECEKAKMRVGL